MRNSFLSACFFLLASTFPPPAKTKLFALPVQSWIKYDGVHFLHRWQGATQEVNCVITYVPEKQQIESVAASVRLFGFDSHNANRDSHALEMLDALVFPKANFTSASIKETEKGFRIKGQLNLHGITKEIIFDTHNTLDNNKLQVEGSFPVALKDHHIEIPALLGIKINQVIQVHFQFVFDTNS